MEGAAFLFLEEGCCKVDVVLDREALFAVRKREHSTCFLLSFSRLFITSAPKNRSRGEGSVWKGWEDWVVWPEEVVKGTSACPFPSSSSGVSRLRLCLGGCVCFGQFNSKYLVYLA